MKTSVVDALDRPWTRAGCAWLLAGWPASVGVLRLVGVPVQEPFIAFVHAMAAADPDAPTRCDGWTVHELAAHLAAGSAELADLLELELSGSPARPTRDFEERERPYREMSAKMLRRRFFEEALRVTIALERFRTSGTDRRIGFTGVAMDGRAIVAHVESELILHRWDIVGSDDVSVEALGRADLVLHAVSTVAEMTPEVFPQRRGDGRSVVLRSAGAADVMVTGGATTSIEIAAPDHRYPVVECHPAARTLLLWGRDPAGLPEPTGDPAVVDAAIAMLLPPQASADQLRELDRRPAYRFEFE